MNAASAEAFDVFVASVLTLTFPAPVMLPSKWVLVVPSALASAKFAPPPAPAPPAAPAAVQNPAPWAQWVLTGVASGPGGPEVWLLNPGSGESRRLAVGESLHEVMLVAAAGEAAEFRLHEERFTVAVGQSLGASYPPGQ